MNVILERNEYGKDYTIHKTGIEIPPMVNYTRKDMDGVKINNLTIIRHVDDYRKGNYKVICKCDCGVIKEIDKSSVLRGLSKSCGCLRRTHGMWKTRFYNCWSSMKQRCKSDESYISNNIDYDLRWEEFLNFYEDMFNSYEDHLELDRIDVTRGYSKNNCRWATESIQCFNQSKSKYNTSGRTGVYYLKSKDKWRASISIDNKVIYLYQGSSFEDACRIREEAELKYFGKVKQ